ncbi:hypothetical protein ACLB1T_02075 [Escherichia coli]
MYTTSPAIVVHDSINAQTRHEQNGGDDSNEISCTGWLGLTWGRGDALTAD